MVFFFSIERVRAYFLNQSGSRKVEFSCIIRENYSFIKEYKLTKISRREWSSPNIRVRRQESSRDISFIRIWSRTYDKVRKRIDSNESIILDRRVVNSDIVA